MSYQLEHKYYHESEITEEVKEAILSRIEIVEPHIVYAKDLPIASPFTIKLMYDKFFEIAETYNKCGLIIDLSESKMPSAETRRMAQNESKKIHDHDIIHMSFVTGKNVFFNTALKFMFNQSNPISFSIHTSYNQALSRVREVVFSSE